jgi:hypothetical protein
MMNCGEGVTVAYPLFQEEGGGSIPTSPLQFEIMEIDIHRAQKLNSLWHSRLPIYATGSCLHATICFGALYDNYFYGAAIWSNPVARLLPQREWLELRRLAISPNAPKNTASRMLRIMIMIIRKRFPHVVKLISYQDTEHHKGTIYKAAGWKIGNRHRGGSWYRPNSHNKSGTPRKRPDLNNAIAPKIRWELNLVNGG